MQKVYSTTLLALASLLLTGPVHAGGPVKHRFLATDSGKARLIYVDQFHPERDWSVNTPPGPRDIRLVDHHQKVLISHRKGAAEYELRTGKQTWLLDTYNDIQSAIRLPNGHTLLGGNSREGIVLYEVDAQGKEKSKRLLKGKKDIHIMQLLQNGNLLLTHNEYKKKYGPSWVLEVDPEGQTVWQAELPDAADDVERLENGHTLAPTGEACTVVEFNRAGKIVATFAGTGAHSKLGLKWLASVEVLNNGNLVVTNWLGHGVPPIGPHLVEFDRTNKVVWTWEDHQRARMIHNSLVLE